MYMTGGILSGVAIADAVDNGEIDIDPYQTEHLNPASYDLTLGDGVVTYEFNHVHDVKEVPPLTVDRSSIRCSE